ncbi:hypothetical protein VTI28DRAFT_1666 [Corynascus sepedonium]
MATHGRPAQPKSILRGHKAQVHAAAFVRANHRLVTGDADGFIVAWDLTIMRPRAVWKAHDNAILGIASWGDDRLITHGRDNKLIVWKFTSEEESRLSTTLPLDPAPEARPQPWMLYMLEVNTMNFCSFSHCPASAGLGAASSDILLAVPNTLASEAIDIFHLPSQARQHTVKLGDKNGMVMALSIFYHGDNLTLVAGYENGMATVARLTDCGDWSVQYQAHCHSQPILSLDVSPKKDFFLTSSADAIIAKHPLPPPPSSAITSSPPQPNITTTSETPSPANPSPSTQSGGKTPSKSLLTAALSSNPPPPSSQPTNPATTAREQHPLKIVNTKHAGQQSLHIRSDGRIFATAGWDARVRVYSARTLAEVAVLKWHTVGCYATAFAAIVDADTLAHQEEGEEGRDEEKTVVQRRQNYQHQQHQQQDAERKGEEPRVRGSVETKAQSGNEKVENKDDKKVVAVPKLVELTVREKRIQQVREAHWLVAGSKDGKVSLWDVF